jgi:hypothetical protein
MSMIALYRNLAVKHKLRLIIVFAVVAALIPASIGVVAYDRDGDAMDVLLTEDNVVNQRVEPNLEWSAILAPVHLSERLSEGKLSERSPEEGIMFGGWRGHETQSADRKRRPDRSWHPPEV